MKINSTKWITTFIFVLGLAVLAMMDYFMEWYYVLIFCIIGIFAVIIGIELNTYERFNELFDDRFKELKSRIDLDTKNVQEAFVKTQIDLDKMKIMFLEKEEIISNQNLFNEEPVIEVIKAKPRGHRKHFKIPLDDLNYAQQKRDEEREENEET